MSELPESAKKLLIESMGGKEKWEEFLSQLINTAAMFHVGVVKESTVDELVTRPLAEWLKNLSTEQRKELQSSLEVDMIVRDIFLEALKLNKEKLDAAQ